MFALFFIFFFPIGMEYYDNAWYDIVSMDAYNLLSARNPWQYD